MTGVAKLLSDQDEKWCLLRALGTSTNTIVSVEHVKRGVVYNTYIWKQPVDSDKAKVAILYNG